MKIFVVGLNLIGFVFLLAFCIMAVGRFQGLGSIDS